jgi:hypothetical protein
VVDGLFNAEISASYYFVYHEIILGEVYVSLKKVLRRMRL